MKSIIQKLFLSKKALIVAGVLALAFWALYSFFTLQLEGLYTSFVDGLIFLVLIIALLSSYDKGTTTIQKTLLGALFMMLLKCSLDFMFPYLLAGNPIFLFIGVGLIILSLALFVFHLLLQNDHFGTNISLFFNQLSTVVMFILTIYALIQILAAIEAPLATFFFILAWACTYSLLICIETRIQVYKQVRTDALRQGKWTYEAREKAKEIFKI